MFSIFANLLLSVNTCSPDETSKVSSPSFPSKVSELPCVAVKILKVSAPPSPVSVSAPAPPIIV